MLKKLISYEFKATGRTLGILYLALIILSCVCRLIFGLSAFDEGTNFATGVSSIILIFLYAMLICAVLVVTFLMIIQRFWKNLLQNEGYLMNMLPVKSWQHIASKLLVSVVWTFVSVVVVFLSILILSTLSVRISPNFLGEFLKDLIGVFPRMGFGGTYLLIMGIVILILVVASSILQMYTAMSIGQTQNRYKILCSFAAYIVLSIIFQLIVSLLTWLTGAIIPDGLVVTMVNTTTADQAIYLGTSIVAVYYLARCAILFFITNYCLKNKLNLE